MSATPRRLVKERALDRELWPWLVIEPAVGKIVARFRDEADADRFLAHDALVEALGKALSSEDPTEWENDAHEALRLAQGRP